MSLSLSSLPSPSFPPSPPPTSSPFVTSSPFPTSSPFATSSPSFTPPPRTSSPDSITLGSATPTPSPQITGLPAAVSADPFPSTTSSNSRTSNNDSRTTAPLASSITTNSDISGISLTPTQNSGATTTTAAALTASERISVGPIIGGVVGGIAFLALLIGTIIIVLRRRRCITGDEETRGLLKRDSQAPMPYQFIHDQPPILWSLSDTSANLKSNIARTASSISKAGFVNVVPHYPSIASTREKRTMQHLGSPMIAANGQLLHHLSVNTSSLDRRLTMQTVSSQQTGHSEALPPYNIIHI